MKDKLLSVREVGEILGIRPKTIYQWHWLKLNLTFIKVGRSLRISEKDLISFIQKRKKYPKK